VLVPRPQGHILTFVPPLSGFVPPLSGFVPPMNKRILIDYFKCVPPPILCVEPVGLSLNQ